MRQSKTCAPRAAIAFPWLFALEIRARKLLRWLAFRPYAGTIALVVLCCALYLPGIATLPVTDRDEARFAQASKQMLETGNFVDIRFQKEPRYKKPIGIYWLQSAAVATAKQAGAKLDSIWAYRIPSFFGALAAVLLTLWTARPVLGRQDALAASALFAACLTLTFEAHVAKSDAALIATIVLAQGALMRLYLARAGAKTHGLAALFWLALGAAILIKGPVAPALALLTVAAVLWRDRKRGWLKNLHWRWGLPLLLTVTLPWFAAIGISSHGEFFRSSLGQDFAGKLQSGQEKHWGPPGFYFIAFWWTFWPATLFVTLGGVAALWVQRHSRRVLFLLAWIVPFWLVIEAVPTKLPHYALPLYPAIAMAAVVGMRAARNTGLVRSRLPSALWAIIAALQIALLAALAWIAETPETPFIIAILAVFAVAAAVTAIAAWKSCWNAALFGAVLSGFLFFTAAFQAALPSLKPLWISQTAAEAVEALNGCSDGPIGFAGFSPPSLVFLNGTDTLLTAPVPLANALASGQAGLAFVNWSRRQEFEKAFQDKAGTDPNFLGCVDGIDINGRGPTRLQIYTTAAAASRPKCKPAPQIECPDHNAVRWRRVLNSKF